MSRARVAFASAVDGALALGDPDRRHVRLDPSGVREFAVSGDHLAPTAAVISWDQIVQLDADAPTGIVRFPGAVSGLASIGLEAIGFSYAPNTADVVVVITTLSGECRVTCDGYLGSSYWRPHVSSLRALLTLFVNKPSTRKWLTDPSSLLGQLSTVARET